MSIERRKQEILNRLRKYTEEKRAEEEKAKEELEKEIKPEGKLEKKEEKVEIEDMEKYFRPPLLDDLEEKSPIVPIPVNDRVHKKAEEEEEEYFPVSRLPIQEVKPVVLEKPEEKIEEPIDLEEVGKLISELEAMKLNVPPPVVVSYRKGLIAVFALALLSVIAWSYIYFRLITLEDTIKEICVWLRDLYSAFNMTCVNGGC